MYGHLELVELEAIEVWPVLDYRNTGNRMTNKNWTPFTCMGEEWVPNFGHSIYRTSSLVHKWQYWRFEYIIINGDNYCWRNIIMIALNIKWMMEGMVVMETSHVATKMQLPWLETWSRKYTCTTNWLLSWYGREKKKNIEKRERFENLMKSRSSLSKSDVYMYLKNGNCLLKRVLLSWFIQQWARLLPSLQSFHRAGSDEWLSGSSSP